MRTPTNRETPNGGSSTPRPIACDSDIVVLAVVTAQALEDIGETREAAQWLLRAADQATKDGNCERALCFARAGVSLLNTTVASAQPSSTPAPRNSSLRTTPARSSSPRLTVPPPAAWSMPEGRSSALHPASLRHARVFTEPPPEPNQASPDSTIEAMLALMATAG